MAHHRNWASINGDILRHLASFISEKDRVKLLTVCKAWRKELGEQPPYLMLMECRSEDNGSINDLIFFDIQTKMMIPLRHEISMLVHGSIYLGSGYGCIFIGNYNQAAASVRGITNQDVIGYSSSSTTEIGIMSKKRKRQDNEEQEHGIKEQQERQQLRITIINPFRSNNVVNLPALLERANGQVFLSNKPKEDVYNERFTVFYCNGSRINFIKPYSVHNEWRFFDLHDPPEDVLGIQGKVYVNYSGKLYQVDVERQRVLPAEFFLSGLLPRFSSDPLLWVRYLQGLDGRLHVLCTASYQHSTYCFAPSKLTRGYSSGVQSREPPQCMKREKHLFISSNLSIQWRNRAFYIHNYHPDRLLLKLSSFWGGYGQKQWQPIGWISPPGSM